MNTPLISCIMPTMPARKALVAQAIRLFNAQDYPNKELIIVESGDCQLASGYPVIQDDIEYIWMDTFGSNVHLTIGAKRNLACNLAKGEIICHWDDDDYYGPHRLSQQAEPIISERADVTAFRMTHMLITQDMALWECSPAVHKALFAKDVRSGTLMYRSHYLIELHYPNMSVGEDVQFLYGLLRRGARLEQIVSPGSYVCVRHGSNSTSDILGLDLPGWQRVSLDGLIPPEVQACYRQSEQEWLERGVKRLMTCLSHADDEQCAACGEDA